MINFYIISTGLIVLFMILEYFWLSISIHKIPIRILINGTRGKTTTVKILHKLLNQAGLMTISKTTGDLPQLHYPDGTMRRLRRFGPANIKENIRQIIHYTRYKPQVMILECMAIHPELQSILSHRIFRPTHIAITNIKRDHLEVMGPHHPDIATIIAQSLTPRARKFIPEELKGSFPPEISHTHGIRFYKQAQYPKKFTNIPPEIIEKNWGLIRILCEELQINSKRTSSIFSQEWITINEGLRITIRHLNLEFIDLFSVNDPDTAIKFVNHLRSIRSVETAEIALLNTRTDRPLRSLEFLKSLKNELKSDEIWVTGKGRNFIKNKFKNNSKNGKPVLFFRNDCLFKKIKQGFSHPTCIYGLANHHGMNSLLDQLRHIS